MALGYPHYQVAGCIGCDAQKIALFGGCLRGGSSTTAADLPNLWPGQRWLPDGSDAWVARGHRAGREATHHGADRETSASNWFRRPDTAGHFGNLIVFFGRMPGVSYHGGSMERGKERQREGERKRGRENEREREINIIKYSYKYGLGSSWMLSTNASWSKKRGQPEIIEHYQKAWLSAGVVGLVMPLFPWWPRCRRRGWRNCRWQPVTASWASSQRWTRWPHAGCAACRD